MLVGYQIRETFCAFIESVQAMIYSDHKALQWLMSMNTSTGRLARWALRHQAFDLEIIYMPGYCNAVADLLSSLPEHGDAPNLVLPFSQWPSTYQEALLPKSETSS